MCCKRVSLWPLKSATALLLLFCSFPATAQRHGGGSSPGAIPGGAGRPDGVDEKDSLHDFHHAMAVEATAQQIAEFQSVVKITDDARSKIEAIEKQAGKSAGASAAPVDAAQLDQSIENARTESKKFLDGFSEAQKSGLKDLEKRLTKADSDLEAAERRLDQALQIAPSDFAPRAEGLDKALADFSTEQLALGREMGIILASASDLTFTFVTVKNTAKIGNQTTAVPVSGELSQTAAEGGQRKFKLEMIGDLLDLQQNITQLLRPQIERTTGCGEHIVLRQAALSPASPASLLVLQMHYERWSCMGSISTELAEGDGSVEMKLTASVEKPSTLKLAVVYSRIDAAGMMGDSLKSGNLGDDLRDEVSQSILAALQAAADFKTNLPPAVQASAVVQSARFQDATAGRLTLVLDGQMEVSTDQVNMMASQLNQSLAAQRTAER